MTRQSAALSKQLLSTRLGQYYYAVEDLRGNATITPTIDADWIFGTTNAALNCTPDANGVVPLTKAGLYLVFNTVVFSFQSGTITTVVSRFMRLASVSAGITRDGFAGTASITTTSAGTILPQSTFITLSAADIALATDWTVKMHLKATSGNITGVMNDAVLMVAYYG